MADLARLSGWSREYLLWELPYAAGLGLLHSESIYHGSTVKLVNGRSGGTGAEANRESMRGSFQRMREGVTDGPRCGITDD